MYTVKGEFVLINELAKIAGVSRQAVRYYEKLGLLKSEARPAGSRSYGEYDAQSIRAIATIKLLQSLGFRLEEIGQFIHHSVKDYRDAQEREAILRVTLAELEAKRRDLDTLIGHVRQALKRYEE